MDRKRNPPGFSPCPSSARCRLCFLFSAHNSIASLPRSPKRPKLWWWWGEEGRVKIWQRQIQSPAGAGWPGRALLLWPPVTASPVGVGTRRCRLRDASEQPCFLLCRPSPLAGRGGTEVSPGMLHVPELQDVHRRWRHLCSGGEVQAVLVSLTGPIAPQEVR